MPQEKIRVAIVGYGNLGKGIELGLLKNPDMELKCIFTRRDPSSLKTSSNVPVVSIEDAENWKDKIDVAFLCGGSATDLSTQGPQFASMFNTVCSFDTHAKAYDYYKAMNEAATKAGKVAMTSIGWDPGLFSHMRLLISSILPDSKAYTFWGTGVSQGHSDAVRRIEGVKDARQYTVPVESAIERVRNGETPDFTTREKHTRVCYVVAEDGADKDRIEKEIKSMPNYFDEYDTTVHFISEEELKKNHSKMPHGGFVIHSGETGDGNKQIMEFSLKLDSNPEFTASVLIAFARANYKLQQKEDYGAKSIFEIPPYLLSNKSLDDLRKNCL